LPLQALAKGEGEGGEDALNDSEVRRRNSCRLIREEEEPAAEVLALQVLAAAFKVLAAVHLSEAKGGAADSLVYVCGCVGVCVCARVCVHVCVQTLPERSECGASNSLIYAALPHATSDALTHTLASLLAR
jgi:hypothetical protein